MDDLNLNFDLGPNGDVEVMHGSDEVINRIKFLLTTRKGAVPMEPTIGSNLILFGTTNDSEEALEAQISSLIKEHVPEAKLLGVRVNKEGHSINTAVYLKVGTDRVSFNI